MTKENLEEKISLPYYVNIDTINKMLAAVSKKGGDETSIKNIFGEGKFKECKRALISFGILNSNLTFTEFGKNLYYALNETEKFSAWAQVIKKIKPYDDFINYYVINRSNQVECEIEIIKKFWAQKNICKSDTMRKDAAITFAYIITLAGLGQFKKGKQGNTRIIFDLNKLNNYYHDHVTETREYSVSTDINNEDEIKKDATDKDASIAGDTTMVYKKTIKGNSNLNINIMVNVNSLEELKEIMEYLKND